MQIHLRMTCAAVLIMAPMAHAEARHHHRHDHHHGYGGARLAGVISPLAAKARQIMSDCGSILLSGVRHTFIAGTHHRSEHWTGHAVDLAGNPGCIYRHLVGWAGGYSTDYGAVRHVHISLGGREDGRRFAHGGRRHHHRRIMIARR